MPTLALVRQLHAHRTLLEQMCQGGSKTSPLGLPWGPRMLSLSCVCVFSRVYCNVHTSREVFSGGYCNCTFQKALGAQKLTFGSIWCSRGCLWTPFGLLWGSLGVAWRHFGLPLEVLWRAPGVLGFPRGTSGLSWESLGAFRPLSLHILAVAHSRECGL